MSTQTAPRRPTGKPPQHQQQNGHALQPDNGTQTRGARAKNAFLPPYVRRRSERRLASTRNTPPKDTTTANEDKGAGTIPNLGHLHKMKNRGMSTKASADKIKEQVEGSKEGVANAMQDLEEMELTLKKDVKRRKLQVEASVIKPDSDATLRTRSRSKSHQKSDVLKVDRLLLTPERGMDDAFEEAWEPAFQDELEAEADADSDAGPVAAIAGARRTPAVNSDYLPLPWKGRLGYACLNTYLRSAKPPVFSSRTLRIASIIEHRHPLADPTQPEHPTKNRPDKTQKADIALGQKHVQSLGLANARDIAKMLRWNDKYNIKFMRLSSEMFPFASHEEYGYKLAPFASEVLAEAGRVAAELGHRLTTHPGQFTQLGSPRKEVVTAAIRDLEYHDEMLSLLKLPPQQDRDAVMILHMGGTFNDAGGKPATLDRFRKNYATLSDSIKRRLVLENDDVSWSVHDLLPVCEELNIPMVLDYHHHNIIFDADKCQEGTFDISQPEISERITRTWTRKSIKQKMHYSEPCAGTLTPRDRRKHSARVATLPPCPPDMDLMIEAKDKEQAVFELMRRFKLPGHERIADIVAHQREDQDRAPLMKAKAKKTSPKKRKAETEDGGGEGENLLKKRQKATKKDQEEQIAADAVNDLAPGGLSVTPEDFGMGGPIGRVYWPVGFEEWLAPRKRVRKLKIEEPGDA